ncbi:uncharacterized protein LOC115443031 [Manduca sexta]|uniref:uncharacterized protein LOC115443031 n=1 Tax=Manduca sexta TaxID=7130 RepID=UPI00188E6CCF|nr:uncharacterized protein LOC115443031 [Manduca sexta]
MSEEKEKLSSDKVPEKLTEWLLDMGCPAEKVPSLDSAKQMCRGQYYIVWRSLMGEVEPKATIKYKRNTVFTDDVRKCQEKNVLHESNASVIVPDELSVWSQHMDLKQRVSEAEARLMQAKQDLQLLIDKASSKLAQRNLAVHQVQDVERRVLLLQKYLEHLQTKKSDLQDIMVIAKSLSCHEENGDVKSKLDKCVSAMRRVALDLRRALPRCCRPRIPSLARRLPPSIVIMIVPTAKEQVSSLVRCGGDAVWGQLHQRRAGLCLALSHACAMEPANSNRVSAKSIVAHSAALHCTIALEAMKNKALIRQARQRLAAAVTQLNDHLSGDACEYLVVNCERAGAQARVESVRRALQELRAHVACSLRRGRARTDALAGAPSPPSTRLFKKEDLKRSMQSLATLERKIFNVRDCLRTVINCIQNRVNPADMERFRNYIVLPQDPITTLQQFYEERRINQKKMELSLDMDISGNNSAIDSTDDDNSKLVDELKIYLDKFSLEKNRKLVLESGDKIWTFETLESSLQRLHRTWLSQDLPGTVVCPSVSLASNLLALESCARMRNELELMLQRDDGEKKFISFDFTSQKTEENEVTDKIKKRLNENIVNLHKVNRTLDLGAENLKFWAANDMKNYINSNRTMDGKTFKEFEKYYLDCLRL